MQYQCALGSNSGAGHEAMVDCVHLSALVVKSISKGSEWALGQLLVFGEGFKAMVDGSNFFMMRG